MNQQDYVLVHAGVKLFRELDWETQLNLQTRDDLLWIREDFLTEPLEDCPFTIIHGHTPTPHYPKIYAFSPTSSGISIETSRIGIDCGAGVCVQLGLYCLTNGTCYYTSIN